MAQRKTPSSSGRSSGSAGTRGPAGSRAPGAKATATKPAAAASGGRPAARPPQKNKPGKSIVNQRQTPWGLIITTIVIIAFAGGIIGFAVSNSGGSSKGGADASNPYTQPEVAAAKAIPGVQWKVEPDHYHVFTKVNYDTTPPTGGNHSQIWADCSGTVYPNAIANENAVHMLEHGAVWISYKPGLAQTEIDQLSALVNGVDRMAMSPYPGLKSNISLQAWGYQLFVDNASDPRIQQFVAALRSNTKVTPEQASGVTCSDPQFKAKPSTFGNPIFTLS